MSFPKITLVIAACAGLAACGDTLGEQALGGAAVGAGAAAVTGGSLGTGAAVGAGANVLACQTNLVNCD
jgi:osmotically inducible lipoprotein OsmB